MSFRQFVALISLSTLGLLFVAGCGSAPADVEPQAMTPEEQAEYTRMTLEQQRKARQ